MGKNNALYNTISEVLGKRFCNLRVRLIVLFILHSSVSRCFSNDNRVSRIITRCFWDIACVTLLLLLLLLLILLNTSGRCDIALISD